MNAIIKDAYKRSNYAGADKIYRLLKSENQTITRVQIDDVIKDQLTYQLHKKQTKKVMGHIVAFHPNDIWLMDLSDMSNLATKNKNYKWILLMIDVFTRKAYAKPLKNKLGDTILEAFDTMTSEIGSTPYELISDNGTEFTNNNFQNFITKHKITHVMSEPNYHPTLGMIDRLTRTLKESMYKYFTANNTANWIDYLPELIENYNNNPNRGIFNITPNNAEDMKDMIRELNTLKFKCENNLVRRFKVGDNVRTKLKKAIFEKGYSRIWSVSTHKIISIQGINATLDNDNMYKMNDLQKVTSHDIDIPVEIPEVEHVNREAKHVKKLKTDGVIPENIIEPREKRDRKAPDRYK